MTEMVLIQYTGDEPVLVGALSHATYEFAPGDPPKRVHPDDADHFRGLPGFVVVSPAPKDNSAAE